MSAIELQFSSTFLNALATVPGHLEIDSIKELDPAVQKRRIAELARFLKRQGLGSHLEIYKQVVKRLEYKSIYHLNRSILPKERSLPLQASHEVLPAPENTNCFLRARVGFSEWHAAIGKYGPTLHLDLRPPTQQAEIDQFNSMNLGLYPVLVPASTRELRTEHPARGWVLTKYGNQKMMTLEFLSDGEAIILADLFGIFIHKGREISSCQREQSEMCFLMSPAFASLRSSLRSGQLPLPAFRRWSSGLTDLWHYLVLASDQAFTHRERITKKHLLSRCAVPLENHLTLNDEYLTQVWEEVPRLGVSDKGLIPEFEEYVSRMQTNKGK